MQGKTSRVNDSRKKEEEVVAMGLHKQVPRRVHVRGERRKAIFGINAPVSRSLGRHSFRRCLRFPRLPQVLILGRHFFLFLVSSNSHPNSRHKEMCTPPTTPSLLPCPPPRIHRPTRPEPIGPGRLCARTTQTDEMRDRSKKKISRFGNCGESVGERATCAFVVWCYCGGL